MQEYNTSNLVNLQGNNATESVQKSRHIKVLHVYAGNLFGGVETLLVTLAQERNLCPQLQSHFALCFEGRLAAELRTTGIEVHMIDKVRVSRPWTVWRARNQLARLLDKECFDVVICHSCWSQAIFGSVVRSHNLPLVFWCHDPPTGQHWLEQWAKQTLPDLAITNSRYTLAAIPKLYPGIPSHHYYLPVSFPHSFNHLSVRNAVRAELNTPQDAVVIIQASRMERFKGQSVLLSSLAQLRDTANLPNWICWIAGGGQRSHEAEFLQELKAQAETLGIAKRIKFLGQRADVPRLLAASDIYCQPNISPEGFGIAFVEALYAGLPVVTTAIGGGLEIVNDSCGRLIAPNDSNALSLVLRSLMTNPGERADLSAGGPSRAKQLCHPAKQMDELYDLLCQVVMANCD